MTGGRSARGDLGALSGPKKEWGVSVRDEKEWWMAGEHRVQGISDALGEVRHHPARTYERTPSAKCCWSVRTGVRCMDNGPSSHLWAD